MLKLKFLNVGSGRAPTVLPPPFHCVQLCFFKLLPVLSDSFLFLDLQKLKHTESDKLQVQIQAYLDNVFDVGALLEDAETKNAALERVEELEENISHVSTKLKSLLPLEWCRACSAQGLWYFPFFQEVDIKA